MSEKSAIGKVLWAPPANRLLVAHLAVLALGVGLVVLLYALGFPNVGAVCILAGLYVIVFSLLRSGAFSTTWLEPHTPLSARARNETRAGESVDVRRCWGRRTFRLHT